MHGRTELYVTSKLEGVPDTNDRGFSTPSWTSSRCSNGSPITWFRTAKNIDHVLTEKRKSLKGRKHSGHFCHFENRDQKPIMTECRRLHNVVKYRALIRSKGLIHFLTGHAPHPPYLQRMNLREDDRSEYREIGTPEHMLFHCRLRRKTCARRGKSFVVRSCNKCYKKVYR